MPRTITVKMPDGSDYVIRRLLGKGSSNVKLNKSEKTSSVLNYGLSLAAHKMSGYNVCPNASPGCIASCIVTSGFAGIFDKVNIARIAKTRAWFSHRAAFKEMLLAELGIALKRANKLGKQLVVRLNVFSDIPWEKVFPEVFAEFPDVQFYDYTKNPQRAVDCAEGISFPANYHLTFSRSEKNQNDSLNLLRSNVNVTVVFDKKQLPEQWENFPVISGDKTDLRFLDPQGGNVIGLYAKGKGRKDKTGFVVKSQRYSLPTI